MRTWDKCELREDPTWAERLGMFCSRYDLAITWTVVVMFLVGLFTCGATCR